MDLETRHLLAIVLLTFAGVGCIAVTLFSQRVRDFALFFLVFGSVLMERMDVTFWGNYWYRGTARGVQVSLVDLAPLGLFVATLIFPRYRRGRFYWPASFGLLLIYLTYCFGSVLTATPQLYGVWELAKTARSVLVFLAAALFIRTRRELGIVVFALCCTACLEAFNGIEQRMFKGALRVPGTLDHENTLSTYLCMIGPVLLAAALSNWSKWLRWFAGFSWFMAAGAELMTVSRMGIPVFAVMCTGTAIMCTSWRPTKEKLAIVIGVAAALSIFLAFTWPSLKNRYTQGNIRAELTDEHAVETRGVYWRIATAMVEDHPYGVGLNNWSYYVSKVYGRALGYNYYYDYDDIIGVPTKEQMALVTFPPAADTLPALLIGELGFAGLGLFLLIWFRWFQMGIVFLFQRLNPDPMNRMGIGFLFAAGGVFLQNATEWTYKQPGILFTFHVLMGALAGIYKYRKNLHRAAKEAEQEEYEAEIENPAPAVMVGAPEVSRRAARRHERLLR